ncbi:hypothetical protein PMAYCL1PPCAC_07609, partial [Pristionchus mayeri]
ASIVINCSAMRLFLALLALSLHSSASYKILVYNSKFGHSHSNFLGQIADILAEEGHNVTSLLPIADPGVRDCTEKSTKIHVQQDPEVKKIYDVDAHSQVNFFEMNIAHPIAPLFVGPMFADIFSLTCKRVMEEPGLIERLRDEKYDVMIGENFDVCGVGLSKAIAPKSLIGVSTSCIFGWQFDEWGVPSALSYRPTSLLTSFDVHSFFARLNNIYGDFLGRFMFWFSRRSVNRVLQEKYGPDYPSVAEQSSNVAFVFTNSEPLIESAAPTMSRVIDIGGIGAKKPKKLDQYWEGILTLRPKTILLSFGSIAKSIIIPPASKKGLLRTIARFPDVTFIWKYEDLKDEFATGEASKLQNLVMTEWMPQVDILAHPNLAAFMTHGGMGSTHETALRGVPGIFIPLFADQPRNAGMMEFNGFGRVFDKYQIHDDEKLAEVISDVLGNEKYRENAKKISSMLSKKPFKSRELLIKHVEFAAQFGPSSALRPQSIDMSFIEYNNIDIIVLLLFGIAIFAYLFAIILKSLARKDLKTSKTKTD